MSRSDEETVFANMSQLSFYTQTPQGGGDGKRRRRKKKAKAGDCDAAVGSGGGEGKKRRLTDAQVKFLETNFGEERKLESARKLQLAAELGLDPKQVAVWFQNRRARLKSKTLEEEYVKLKTEYDESAVHKCHLENEILKLKKQLTEAEEDIRRLSGCATSSSAAGTYQTPIGDFGADVDDMMMYGYEYSTVASYLMDWGYLL